MSEELELFQGLLTADIDNIEDLPDFCVPPRGLYRIKCEKMEVGTNKDQTGGQIKAIFSVQEPLELADESAVAPEPGSLVSQQWGGEFGIKKFKKIFLPCFEAVNVRTIAEFIDSASGLEFAANFGVRTDSEKLGDDGQPRQYADLKDAILA